MSDDFSLMDDFSVTTISQCFDRHRDLQLPCARERHAYNHIRAHNACSARAPHAPQLAQRRG